MTAQIQTLITGRDNCEIVAEQIGAILLEESAAQQVLAAKGAVTYARAGVGGTDSDYTARSTVALSQTGAYTVTAGTLVDGVGQWTAVAPDSSADTFTSSAADDDLVFSVMGFTLAVTDWDEPWQTGDVVTVTTYDPDLYKLRVYVDRSAPWQEWVDSPPQSAEAALPMVSINFTRQDFAEQRSNSINSQHAGATYWIDVLAYGIATETDAGHTPADAKAAAEASRVKTLVRRILMSGQHTFLGLRGTVFGRWLESISRNRPPPDEVPVQNIVADRLVLRVDFNEVGPEAEGNPCETVHLDVYRSDSGELLLSQEF